MSVSWNLYALIYWGLWTVSQAMMTLQQIHIITRHGSRYVLTKDHQSLGEGTSAFLTSTGIQQMHDLGIQLRDKYSDAFDFLPNYDPTLVYFESSDFDRTIVSASALASGLFQNENSTLPSIYVPVHTTKVQNDLYIRAYDKCTLFTKELNALYQTEEWKQLQDEHDALLRKLAAIESFQKYADSTNRVSLAQAWNVYDAIYVAKSECESSTQDAKTICKNLDDPFVKDVVSDTEFEQLRSLVGKTEFMRYHTQTAARLVALNLLRKITSRILFSDSEFSREEGSAKIYLYSGHYPLLLALLAALGYTYSDNGIPNYASAIVIEVYEEDKEKRLAFYYHYGQGLGDETLQSPMKFLGRHCREDFCPLENILQLVEGWSETKWCDACGGDSQVDICLQVAEFECESRTGLSIFGGMAVGVVVGFIGMLVCGQTSKEKRKETVVQVDTSPEHPVRAIPKTEYTIENDSQRNMESAKSEEVIFEHQGNEDAIFL